MSVSRGYEPVPLVEQLLHALTQAARPLTSRELAVASMVREASILDALEQLVRSGKVEMRRPVTRLGAKEPAVFVAKGAK